MLFFIFLKLKWNHYWCVDRDICLWLLILIEYNGDIKLGNSNKLGTSTKLSTSLNRIVGHYNFYATSKMRILITAHFSELVSDIYQPWCICCKEFSLHILSCINMYRITVRLNCWSILQTTYNCNIEFSGFLTKIPCHDKVL